MDSRNKSLGTSGKNYQFNPLYDPSFLRKLLVHYLPYFPIISHAILHITEGRTSDDTTNAIGTHVSFNWKFLVILKLWLYFCFNYSEQYHGLLKANIYEGELREKIPRFLRKQGEFIKGN